MALLAHDRFSARAAVLGAIVHKLCALSSMLVLGGAVVPNRRRQLSLVVGGLFGCLLLTGLLSYALKLEMSVLAWLSVPLGFFCVASFIYDSLSTKRFWIFCWLLGRIVFLVSLRFAATRYWLPFYCSVLAFDAYKQTEKYWVGLMAVVSIHLVWDDAQLARAQHQLAKQTIVIFATVNMEKNRLFCRSLGLAVCLRSSGWSSVEDDSKYRTMFAFLFHRCLGLKK